MNSIFLRLGKNDFIKGLVVAAIGAAAGVIYPAIKAGTIINGDVITGALQAGGAAGLAYLTKNLFTNSAGQMATPESKDAPK